MGLEDAREAAKGHPKKEGAVVRSEPQGRVLTSLFYTWRSRAGGREGVLDAGQRRWLGAFGRPSLNFLLGNQEDKQNVSLVIHPCC